MMTNKRIERKKHKQDMEKVNADFERTKLGYSTSEVSVYLSEMKRAIQRAARGIKGDV